MQHLRTYHKPETFSHVFKKCDPEEDRGIFEDMTKGFWLVSNTHRLHNSEKRIVSYRMEGWYKKNHQ